MKKLATNVLVALTIFPLVNSCGKKSSGGDSFAPQLEIPSEAPTPTEIEAEIEAEGSVDGSTIDGQYMAKFITLNPGVNGTIPGSLTLFRDGDKLLTYVRLHAGKPSAWHPQGIYRGDRCPDINMGDDRNGDGFIDIEEALAVVGELMVPLDANMDSQAAGKNIYPLADASGYYHFEREASFDKLFDDLRKEDKDPTDHIGKLALDEKFAFQGRVVMVQGIDEATILPDSVKSMDRRRAFQTFPITCGIIAKFTEAPGTPDNGEIPGPIAPIDPDYDRPASTDVPTPTPIPTPTTGGTTVGTTTGTNESSDGEVGDAGGSEDGSNGSTAGGTTGSTTIGGSAGGTTGGTSGETTPTPPTPVPTPTPEVPNTGGATSGGVTSGGSTTGEQPTEEGPSPSRRRNRGGFIGGFIGGSSGGGSNRGRNSGGFIGGFMGGTGNGLVNTSGSSRRSP